MFSPVCVFSFIFGKLRLKIAVVICPLTKYEDQPAAARLVAQSLQLSPSLSLSVSVCLFVC